ncbi:MULTISPECIES: LysR family transcriptional regulator [Delftia]|jgi:LysR family transcriptional regulator of beta-lactamase|uniref:Transcriptional regulator, LysR family n=8 Tax=Delftia TaxID=80865 RepID=A9C393_DELAS|nr:MULTISPECIES: LysR family transcriptional regulator [Delftia]KEH11932.1 LysR family transcriptional regulator [Delftia sp. 670]OLE92208.1 MAG: LysR family transcriptional regulator [Delftia sp. 13_1_40CM_3_66_6]PIF36906.1 LysR family transcriptional regulator of beta-lactamase [Burkholderiales bacterium 23]ABX37204.1 transcriptional regulator, LysR family [Delftia acidovorans SPH-1]AEF89255.1 transcriptional regulator, LysR family [Delftia sp. Cs1-4]
MQLPLNALRMFDAAARHLNLTRAADELCVTQAAVSQHIRNLEERLGKPLFRRLPRGLALTDEGHALWPAVAESFARIEHSLQQVAEPRPREVLTVGVVGTFAIGWLIPRLGQFQQQHPYIDLRLLTHNNRVDLAGEGLDAAVRFGDGAWQGTRAELLLRAPLTPMCTPALAQRLRQPADLAGQTLLRSYRLQEWESWFATLDQSAPLARGAMFDSSLTLAEAAAQGAGVALLPARMFQHLLQQGRLVRPFEQEVDTGAYWLTHLRSRAPSAALKTFRQWLLAQLQ